MGNGQQKLLETLSPDSECQSGFANDGVTEETPVARGRRRKLLPNLHGSLTFPQHLTPQHLVSSTVSTAGKSEGSDPTVTSWTL
ncbi:hypothetical protein CB1_000069015 [Camelus ferus]|nr:hypothetical protein CB1_000069015 [Camelus ferus]